MTPGAYPGCYEEFDIDELEQRRRRNGQLSEETPGRGGLDDLEAELGDSGATAPEPIEEPQL